MSYPDWYGPNVALADAVVLSQMYDRPGNNLRYENAEFLLQDGRLYIIGTNDLTDAVEDLDVFTTTFLGGRVHSGFADHAQKVMRGVFTQGVEPESIKAIVGHSLGAAAAQYLGVLWGKPVISFGSPKLWTRVGLIPSGYRHVRIYDRSDPVVAMPCRWFGWKHFDHASIPLGLPWYLGWVNGFMEKRLAIIKYHLMSQYIPGIQASIRK